MPDFLLKIPFQFKGICEFQSKFKCELHIDILCLYDCTVLDFLVSFNNFGCFEVTMHKKKTNEKMNV